MSEQENSTAVTVSAISEMQTVSNDSLALLTKAEIDTQIATARAFPRSLETFRRKALSMATFTEDIAAACSYSLPRGGKSMEGPSVRLAEIITASYGNIRAGARVIANDGKTVTAQGICHDLESNNSVTVEVRRSILQHEYNKEGKKTGRRVPMTEDMQVVTGQAACAIAYRNAVFKIVPAALCEEIYETAKQVARGTAETLVKRRDKALEYFRGLGVKDAQICEVLEIKKVEDIDLDKLATLTGMKAAIKNGESTVATLFEKPKDDEITLEDLSLLFDMKRSALSAAEIKDADRIISGKETKSYRKLQTLLQGK